MKTKFISALLALSMAAGYLFTVPAYADSAFSGGSGTEDDPYLISKAEDMWQLANDCNSGSSNERKYGSKYFKMTDDIDLGCSETKQWIPIGNYNGDIYFSGNFNGDGHSITGLYIDNDANGQGLFGNSRDSAVRNLNVEGTVKGNTNVAGIMAYGLYMTIYNCSFKGTVYAKGSYAGGIAAHVFGGGNLTNCTNEATVTAGGDRAGGIAGSSGCNISGCKNLGAVKGASYVAGINGDGSSTLGSGAISDCYNAGTVTGTGIRIGGIVGQYYMDRTVTKCYNTGDINGGEEVGGIVGDLSPDQTVSLCFNAGNIKGSSEIGGISGELCNGGVVKNCYNLGDVTAMSSSAGGIVGYHYFGSAGSSGNTRIESAYNTGTVTAVSAYDSIIGFTRNSNFSSQVVNVVSLQGSCSENKYGTVVTKEQLASAATYSSWDSFDSIWQIPSGLGRPVLLSPEETVKISTVDDLCGLSENVRNGNAYKNIYIELTDDIDADGVDWFPIGSYDANEDSARPFLGSFSGNGHTISNLNCDAGNEEYQGLFGYIGAGGRVKDITIDNSCFFSAGEHTGAIAALNAGTIENCKNYAEVIGDEYTGGIVGENQKGGLVTKCYNAGAISSTANEVGGIAGYNIEATISECANDGSVDADSSFAGGVVGQNHTGTVTNCYNTGEIRAVRAYSGGVVGQSIGSGAKISNCYSYGRVYSYEMCGGVAGSNKNDSVIEKCYYLEDMADGGISGESNPGSAQDVSGSAQKLTKAQFRTQSPFSGWDFTNVWLIGSRPYLVSCMSIEGTGTAEDPYLISGAADFEYMKAFVEGGKVSSSTYFLMTADIDLGDESFTPIAPTLTNSFKGVFDGGGHTLTGLNVTYDSTLSSCYGLFGRIDSTGVVKNLNVEGNVKPDGGSDLYVGGIAGINYGTIENCSFSGSVSSNASGGTYIGGIAGYSYGNGNLVGCCNSAEVTGSYVAGGIAGYLRSISGATNSVTLCSNTGNTSGTAYSGGIIGMGATTGTIGIQCCCNNGVVGGATYTGGIIGYADRSSTSATFYIESCCNTGTLSGRNARALIGRIITSPTVTMCYYLEGSGTDNTGSTAKTAAQFASGEVAYLLNEPYGVGSIIWGQKLNGSDADKVPILTSDKNKMVYKITYATKSNSSYATGYGTAEGVGAIPSVSGAFAGWSLTKSASGELLTENTPITKDMTVYALSQTEYGETEGSKTITSTYGTAANKDLSSYMVYADGTSTAGKYTYTIDSGNDTLNATVSGDDLTIPSDAPAGTYNITVTATEKNPKISLMSVEFGTVPVKLKITVVINKANVWVHTEPQKKSLTYNGEEQELVTGGKASGGTLVYSLDGKNYSADIPKGTNAGDYTVYYKVDGGNNYNDTEAKTVAATINKIPAVITEPKPDSAVYGVKLSDITLPDGWKWTDGSTVPTVKNSGYEAVYTASDYANYNWDKVSGYDSTKHTVTRNITVTITKANPVVTPPTGKSLKTTGEMQELIYAGKTTGGTLVYSLDGTNYSAEIPKAKDNGNYTVYYKVIGDDNYNDTQPQTVKAELGKSDIPADNITNPKAKTLEYNGEEQELVTAGVTVEGTKFLYSLDNKTFTEEIPRAVNAGRYTVYYKFDGGELYDDVAVKGLSVAITKKHPIYYIDEHYTELIDKVSSRKYVYGVKLSDIKLTDDFEWQDGSVVPDVEQAYPYGYPALMRVTDDENYDWDSVSSYNRKEHIWYVDIPFKLEKADITNMTAPQAKNLTYNGNAQELVTRGSAEGGTVEYSLDGANYSDTLPVGTNAGEYTIYYKAVGDSNHNDTEAKTIKVTIAKKMPTLTVPDVSGRQVVYGTKLSEISLTGGWSWADGSIVPTVKNNGYDAKITIDYDANYDWESIEGYDAAAHTVTRTLAVTVSKAPSNANAPEGIKATYGDMLAEVELQNGWNWDNPSQTVGNAGTRLFAVTYTPEDSDNYEGINTNISVEVQKANPVVTAPEAKDITYTGLAQELVTAAGTTGGTLLYSLDGDNYFSSVPKGRKAGNYTVYYKVEGDGNYNDVNEQTVTVNIKKATLNPTVSMPDWTLGGQAPEPALTGNLGGGEVKYEYKEKDTDDTTYSEEKPNLAGNYTIRATVTETVNYEGATVTADFTVSDVPGAPVARYLTYTGKPQALVTAENKDFVYSLDGETYLSDIPTGTDAETYKVYFKTGESGVQTLNVTILPAMPNLTEPEISDNVVYGKRLYEIPLPDGWMWANGDTVPDVNNAGYEAVYSIKQDEEDESYKNYEWSNIEGYDEESLTITRMVDLTVIKADVAVTLPRVKMLTYTAGEQELVTTGSARGGETLYSLNGTDFTTNVPTGVDAKTYTVYYKVVGDANHNDGVSGNLTVTIFPKDAELTEPALSSVTYGTKLSGIALPEGWEWIDATIKPTVKNSGYEAKYTVTENPNYSWARIEGYDSETNTVTRTLPLTVNKASSAAEIPASLTATYGDTLSKVELPQGWEWKDGGISVGNAGTHNFAAIYTPQDKENYEAIERDVAVTVNKAQSKVTEPEPKTLVYNGANQELITAPEADGGTVLYSLDGVKYSTAIPGGKDAGEYTVYYKVKGDENHLDTDAETVTASIAKADMPLDVLMLSWYENEEPSDPIIYGNTSGSNVKYEYKPQNSDDSEYSETVPTTNGVYTIKATALETKNYNGAAATSYFAILPSENSEEYALMFINDFLYITAPYGGPCTVIFAAYKNGILQNVSCEEKVFSSAGADLAVMPEELKAGEPDEIRAMLWNNMTDMEPLSKPEPWSSLK